MVLTEGHDRELIGIMTRVRRAKTRKEKDKMLKLFDRKLAIYRRMDNR